MIVIELVGAIDAAGTLKTFYLSNEGYATRGTDTPANTAFEPSVKDPGTLTLSVFGDGLIAGATKLDTGEIVLSNANGQYDAWLTYGFDGRPVTIRQGERGAAYPAGFSTLVTGAVANISADRKELRVRIKDRQHVFETKVLTVPYLGNNTLPNGVEGNANDIKGRFKPKLFGQVLNINPPCVNTSKLTYQVNSGAVQSFDGVYDRGVAITAGADYANLATLEAATPTAGTFVTCKALGLFRLGGAPAGLVTCDVTQGATAADRTVAQVLKALALLAGVTAGEIDSASIAALDTLNASPVGIYVDSEISYAEAMDDVAASVGAYYGFGTNAKFSVGRWSAPSGASLVTIGEFYAGRDTERRPLRDLNVPAWQVKVNHSRRFTTQPTDLAGSVTTERRAALAEPYVSEVAADASVKTQFLQALSFEVNTLLLSAANAATEAARLLTMHKVRRDAFDVPVPLSVLASAGVILGACVTLQISRFGLSGGKLMRVQSVRLELAKDRAIITVWG